MLNESKWYIIQIVSNHEHKVKEALENRIFVDKNSDIEEIYLPYTIRESKSGKILRRPMFPGYLYVKLVMSDQSWYIIRNTEYVTGILGSSGQRTKPIPISEEDIEKIRQKEKEKFETKENIKKVSQQSKIIEKVDFELGDYVEIIDGDFKGKVAKVVDISLMRQTLRVDIEMFGREIKVELPLNIVKKSL